jgi:hypothetical protein
MAQFQISPVTETSLAVSFTTTSSIRIDSINNKYSMGVNFEENQVIQAGETLFIETSFSKKNLEIIDGIRQNDGYVTVEYTEI